MPFPRRFQTSDYLLVIVITLITMAISVITEAFSRSSTATTGNAPVGLYFQTAMTHAIQATAIKSMSWLYRMADASTYMTSLPSEEIVKNAVSLNPFHLRRMSAPIIEAVWESRTLTAAIVFGLVITLVIGLFRYSRSPWRKLPPSPRRLPILGNASQMRDKTWLLSKDCKERFGELTNHLLMTILIHVHGNCRRGYVP